MADQIEDYVKRPIRYQNVDGLGELWIGVTLIVLPLGRLWLGNLPSVLLGLIYFVSGAITLTLYLRRNPVPEQAAE